jgi:hypothetical protein
VVKSKVRQNTTRPTLIPVPFEYPQTNIFRDPPHNDIAVSVSTGGRNHAWDLLVVRILVFCKTTHLDEPATLRLIPKDEPKLLEIVEFLVDVYAIIGEHFRLYSFRPILQPALTIGNGPEADE